MPLPLLINIKIITHITQHHIHYITLNSCSSPIHTHILHTNWSINTGLSAEGINSLHIFILEVVAVRFLILLWDHRNIQTVILLTAIWLWGQSLTEMSARIFPRGEGSCLVGLTTSQSLVCQNLKELGAITKVTNFFNRK